VKYDFDRIYDRSNTGCIKWDIAREKSGRHDIIPMWIADMDFPVAQPIIDALKVRAEHPFYGYTRPGPEVIKAVIDRMRQKFGWRIEPEWIVFTPGVIPALAAAVRALARPGEGIILQEPVYYPFFPVVTSGGCRIVNNGLMLADGRYEMDYEDLEEKLRNGGAITFPRAGPRLSYCAIPTIPSAASGRRRKSPGWANWLEITGRWSLPTRSTPKFFTGAIAIPRSLQSRKSSRRTVSSARRPARPSTWPGWKRRSS
jgi:cystathionine beta-lyase